MVVKNIGIFIPVYHRGELVKASLDSLHTTLLVSSDCYLHVIVAVGINGANETLRKYIIELSNVYRMKNMTYVIYDPKRNLGKPKCVNIMVDMIRKKVPIDYVVSYDSDMVVTDKNWLLKLVSIYESYKPSWGHSILGCLCPNQTIHCCHVLDKDPFFIKLGEYTLKHRAGNEGTAGGVLFTPLHIWETVGGYDASRIYAADDGHFMLACSRYGWICPVVQEVSLMHPFESDSKYADWKYRAYRNELQPNELNGYWG